MTLISKQKASATSANIQSTKKFFEEAAKLEKVGNKTEAKAMYKKSLKMMKTVNVKFEGFQSDLMTSGSRLNKLSDVSIGIIIALAGSFVSFSSLVGQSFWDFTESHLYI